jgi:molybdenum ABC transporter molybdate-binding protein
MLRVLFLIVWFGLLMACGTPPLAQTAAPFSSPTPLVVYADAALANVLRDIGAAFTQANPDGKLEWTFAEPDLLRAKLQQTPPPDIVISAAADLLRNEVSKPIARDALVVVVTGTNPAQLERAQDLNRPGLRVAIAKENTTLGRATRALIENFRHDAAYGPDFPALFYASVTAQANDGRGVMNALLENRADVGIVYASERDTEKKRTDVLPIENELNVPAIYFAALTAQDTERGVVFMDYLHSPQAQSLWRDYGFEPMP